MSNNLASHKINEQQSCFARLVAKGTEPKVAAVAAGYSEARAIDTAGELLRTPHILAAIHLDVRRRLTSGAPMALGVIERMVKDDNTPPKIRLDAAKTILDRAGHIAPRAISDKGGTELSLHEMSLGDLRKLADSLEGELAARATPISASSASVPSQPIDLA